MIDVVYLILDGARGLPAIIIAFLKYLEELMQGPATAKSVTREDLIQAVYQAVGLSKAESAALVEFVLSEIIACLSRGEGVKLTSFGSFVVRNKRQRVGRNPKTGVLVPIKPRRVVVFKASSVLKRRLAKDPRQSDISGESAMFESDMPNNRSKTE
jgi:integration host factor subunit alpha